MHKTYLSYLDILHGKYIGNDKHKQNPEWDILNLDILYNKNINIESVEDCHHKAINSNRFGCSSYTYQVTK